MGHIAVKWVYYMHGRAQPVAQGVRSLPEQRPSKAARESQALHVVCLQGSVLLGWWSTKRGSCFGSGQLKVYPLIEGSLPGKQNKDKMPVVPLAQPLLAGMCAHEQWRWLRWGSILSNGPTCRHPFTLDRGGTGPACSVMCQASLPLNASSVAKLTGRCRWEGPSLTSFTVWLVLEEV